MNTCAIVIVLLVSPILCSAQERSGIDSWKAVHFGFDYGPTFRGTDVSSTDLAFTLSGEYSALGWSFGFVESLATDFESSQTELFAAYSYPLGWVEVSGGLQSFLNFRNGHRDSLELLLEARTEPIYGFNFYLGQFLELTHGVHSYTEFKLSRRYQPIARRFSFEPYALISFGDYHTNDFSFNHSQFGVDTEYRINNHVVIGVYGAVIVPLRGVKMFTGSDDVQGLVGCRISYLWGNAR